MPDEPAKTEVHEDEATIDPTLIETDDDKKLAELLDADASDDSDAKPVKEDTETKAEQEPAKTEEVQEEHSPEYLEAVQVLRRGKVPTELIDKLDQDEALKWAGDLKPVQADGDTLGNKYAQLKQELEELKSAKEPTEPDLGPYKDSLSEINETIGEEASGAIAKLLAKRDQEQKTEIEKLQERVQAAEVNQYHRELGTARDTLVSEFPRLKNAASYDAVLARTQSLLSAPDSWDRYRGNIKTAMQDAATLELGARSEKFANEHNARVSSQQSTEQDTTKASSEPLTRDAVDNLVLKALDEGKIEAAREIEARFQRENRK